MNDKGDFYIGNTKISADSGEQVTFDIPIPTVTGEDPSKLSVVFDEVIIKERLLVEGGASKQILSQFDGPVTFNGTCRFNTNLNVTKELKVGGVTNLKSPKANKTVDGTDTTVCASGTLDAGVNVDGGLAVGKDLYVCKDIRTFDITQSTSTTSGALIVYGGAGIAKDTFIGGLIDVTGNASFKGNVDLGDTTSDTISFLGRVDTDIIPTTNGNKDLGNSGNRWGELHVTATKTGTLEVSSTAASNDKETGAAVITGGVGIGGDLNVGGDITAYASSDENLKQNMVPIPKAIEKIVQISGYTYEWRNNQAPDIGVSAQEIENLGLPGITTTREDGFKAVRYERLIPLLIESIKELNTRVQALEDSA